MPTLIEKVEARAIKHKGHLFLSYQEIESSGLPATALVAALLQREWKAAPDCNCLIRPEHVEEKT